MNIKKINEVKEFYSKKHPHKQNKSYTQKPFFTKVLEKLLK